MAQRLSWYRLLHRRVLLRLGLPIIAGAAMLGYVVGDLAGGLVPPLHLLWLAPGLALGYPFGHLAKVAWDSEAAQIVVNGKEYLLLAAFIAVRLCSRVVIDTGVGELSDATAIALLMTAGTLVGRRIQVTLLNRTS